MLHSLSTCKIFFSTCCLLLCCPLWLLMTLPPSIIGRLKKKSVRPSLLHYTFRIPLLFLSIVSSLLSENILQVILSCNRTTCPLDPIRYTMPQTMSQDLLPFGSTIFNDSITTGHVPTVSKTARVIPILKKATPDTSNISNYQPVSFPSFLSITLSSTLSTPE